MSESSLAPKIARVHIQDEMKQSYLDYAMSVIVGRSLPDVRDGLKPVHRRVLYAMHKLENHYNRAHKKSARIVGDVIGKYHPHGDAAVYETIVRMAQDFVLRYPLVDGQGNFGSIDGDDAAAMRYTEIRQTKISHRFLDDIAKDTVDFVPNYDGSETMPEFLPTSIPNLLVNGTSGIAVGMATDIPPHNLTEVINGCLALLENPELSIAELMEHIPAPDFPTAAFINNTPDIKNAYETGRGGVFIRAKHEIEEMRDNRFCIIVEEIPYQVNKANLLEKIADLVRNDRIDGISDLRDESNKEGIRIVIELKRGAIADVVVNNLFKLSQLETKMSINMVAIVDGKPQRLNLKSILTEFLKHRRSVVTRRTLFLLNQARARAHILEGLAVATANIDEVINLIKKSVSVQEAKENLMKREWDTTEVSELINRADLDDVKPEDLAPNIGINKDTGLYRLSAKQAQAILDLRLQRLTSMERESLQTQYTEVIDKINGYLEILRDPDKLKALIKTELEEVKQDYGDERLSEIIQIRSNIRTLDLIKSEDILVSLSADGYVKAQHTEHFRAQRRGGAGIKAGSLKESDIMEQLVMANTHSTLMCFSNKGRVYWLKCYDLPIISRTAKGKPMVNYLPLQEDEKILAMLSSAHPSFKGEQTEAGKKYITFATDLGAVKRMEMQHFLRERRSGINFMDLNGGNLVAALETDGKEELFFISSQGLAVKTLESHIRPQGRGARGVRGMKIPSDGKMIAMLKSREHSHLLVVSSDGYAKRTPFSEFALKGRGTKGMIAMKFTSKDNNVVGACPVNEDDQIMIIKENGTLMRCPVSGISVQGRAARGVILTRLGEDERIRAVIPVREEME